VTGPESQAMIYPISLLLFFISLGAYFLLSFSVPNTISGIFDL